MLPWTKASLDQSLLGHCPIDNCPHGQRYPWETVPWTNVAISTHSAGAPDNTCMVYVSERRKSLIYIFIC